MQKYRLTIGAFFLALISNISLYPAYADQGPGLSSAQIKDLKSIGSPIMVPLYLPKGFKVIDVDFWNSEEFMVGKGYRILYRCECEGKKHHFYIRAMSAGLGGVPGDITFTVDHSQYGKLYVEIFEPNGPTGRLNSVKQPIYTTQWIDIGDPLHYHFATGNEKLDSPYPTIARMEIIKIIQSLALLP